MKTAILTLCACIFLGGCFNPPTKDDAKEIATVSATALGKSVAEQVAVEVKKAVNEGGLTKEKLEEIGKTVGNRAADATLIALQDYLEKKKKDAEQKGEPSPAWIGIALFMLSKFIEMKRDGVLKRKPIDVNGNGIPDDEEK